jgi:ribosome-associated toxin RatA of RatAB toxin-antitoxin module
MIDGEKREEIPAALEVVYAVVADIEGYVDWHPFFASVAVTGHDDEGRPASAACTHGTPVGTLRTEMRFRYDPHTEVEALREGGDFKRMSGTFTLDEQGSDVTLVTHRLQVDPGMRLGLLLRGPVEEKVRNSVLNGAFAGLRDAVAQRGA